jgi:hypothetical protein
MIQLLKLPVKCRYSYKNIKILGYIVIIIDIKIPNIAQPFASYSSGDFGLTFEKEEENEEESSV